MTKRVLITGAGGFIAGHLAATLAAEGWRVTGVDRPGAPALPSYERVDAARLGESLAPILAEVRPDAVVHTAYDPHPEAAGANVEGTERWLREAVTAGASLQILLSSLSAAPDALAAYGRGKWALEQAFLRANQVPVRLGVVVGPGGMFARLVNTARSSPVIPLLAGGQQLLYVLGIRRLSEILRDIIAQDGAGMRGRAWHLNQGRPYTLREVMAAILREYNLKRLAVPLPAAPMLWGVQLFEKQRVLRLPVSSTNIRGLMQAGRQQFPSDYARFGYPEQTLDELVRMTRL